MTCGDGIFCGICGVYSFMQTKQLSGACLGHPANQGSAGRLKKLLAGEHPTKGAWLGAVACQMDVLGILLPIVLGIMFVVNLVFLVLVLLLILTTWKTTMAYFRIHGGLESHSQGMRPDWTSHPVHFCHRQPT